MNRIKEFRVARKLSQAELARRSGMARPNLSNIETGKATPSVSSARRIAEALGTTLDDIFPIEKGEGA